MKKFFANIKSKFASMKNKAVISAKTALASTSGEGYIDTGVKIIIGVVIGGAFGKIVTVLSIMSSTPLSVCLLRAAALTGSRPSFIPPWKP